MLSKDKYRLSGFVQIEKNGVTEYEGNNLVVQTGGEWVAARFRTDNASYGHSVFDPAGLADPTAPTGIDDVTSLKYNYADYAAPSWELQRFKNQVRFMSLGTGQNSGASGLQSVIDDPADERNAWGIYDGGRTIDNGWGVYDDVEGVKNIGATPTSKDGQLQWEVDRVECGQGESNMWGAMGDTPAIMAHKNPYFGGLVEDNTITYVAEFHPDIRYGALVGMQEGQFQPIVEAGLHTTGIGAVGTASEDLSDLLSAGAYSSAHPTKAAGSSDKGNPDWTPTNMDCMVARIAFPMIAKGPLDMIRMTWKITVEG